MRAHIHSAKNCIVTLYLENEMSFCKQLWFKCCTKYRIIMAVNYNLFIIEHYIHAIHLTFFSITWTWFRLQTHIQYQNEKTWKHFAITHLNVAFALHKAWLYVCSTANCAQNVNAMTQFHEWFAFNCDCALSFYFHNSINIYKKKKKRDLWWDFMQNESHSWQHSTQMHDPFNCGVLCIIFVVHDTKQWNNWTWNRHSSHVHFLSC